MIAPKLPVAIIGAGPIGLAAAAHLIAGGETPILADEMIVATGFRPDLSLLREIRLSLDPWLEASPGSAR